LYWDNLTSRQKYSYLQTQFSEKNTLNVNKQIDIVSYLCRKEKKNEMRFVINKAKQNPTESRDLLKNRTISPVYLTDEEALALIVKSNLTKDAYIQIRNTAKEHKANIYPAYEIIREAKKKCYPRNINISESKGKLEYI
jgi:hypothetical protein